MISRYRIFQVARRSTRDSVSVGVAELLVFYVHIRRQSSDGGKILVGVRINVVTDELDVTIAVEELGAARMIARECAVEIAGIVARNLQPQRRREYSTQLPSRDDNRQTAAS